MSLVLIQSLPSATWRKQVFEMFNPGIHRRMSSSSSSSNTLTHNKPLGPLRSPQLLPMRCSRLFKLPTQVQLQLHTRVNLPTGKLLPQIKAHTQGCADFPSWLSLLLVRHLLHGLQAPTPSLHTAWNVLKLCLPTSATTPYHHLRSIVSGHPSLRWTSQ